MDTNARALRLNLRLSAKEFAHLKSAANLAGLRPGTYARYILRRVWREELRHLDTEGQGGSNER